MASIGSRNTKPELLIRKLLHHQGFRYRLHQKTLPGTPDIVLARHKAVVFANGCFWHGHNCHIRKLDRSLNVRWTQKIIRNKKRDEVAARELRILGWKTLIVWECSLQGKEKLPLNELAKVMRNWILYDTQNAEITGRPDLQLPRRA